MKKILQVLLGIMAFVAISFSAHATLVNLGDPLAATQAAGTWYTDRYAPNGFSYNGGTGVLTESINATDSASARSVSYSSTFYDTQGRKHDLGTGVTSMSIDLFVDSNWASNPGPQRIAGFWGTALDGSNAVSSYPILEFASDGSGARFQGWNDASGWMDYGLSGSFAYNSWHTLGIALNGTNWDYLLDGTVLGSVNAFGSVGLDNAILQGYNKFAGNQTGSYDIQWRNLETNPKNDVPEPGSAPLMALAIGGLAITRIKAFKSKK
jgi:hypothetical protein